MTVSVPGLFLTLTSTVLITLDPVLIQKQHSTEQRSGQLASERLTWKSFYGVVGNPEIRVAGLKCINLSSDTISGIPTFFLM